MKKRLLLLGGVAVFGAAIIAGWSAASGADHGDAPLTKADHQLDINDVYVFRGDRPNTIVLAMTVNPLTMPGDTVTFADDAVYELKIDQNGDAVPDVSYKLLFGSAGAGGKQSVQLRRATGAAAEAFNSVGSNVINGSTSANTGLADIVDENGYRLFAGMRDDPFFFDLNAFKDKLNFRNPGVDFFKGTNVSVIVLEAPESAVEGGDATFAVWGTTHRGGTVVDRMGRPAINTVFVPAEKKDAFNATLPEDDVATWKDTFVATLNSLKSNPAIADALLPDVIAVDASKPLNFLNGRAPADDVIDAELQLITGSSAASDHVSSNDRAFGQTFPFFASVNTEPLPATPVPAATKPAAAPTATPRGGVIGAPDTGTGDASGGDNDIAIWILVGVAGAAAVLVAGGAAMRRRPR